MPWPHAEPRPPTMVTHPEASFLLGLNDQPLLHIMGSLTSLELSRMDRVHPRFSRKLLASVTESEVRPPSTRHGEESVTTVTKVRKLSLVAEAARMNVQRVYASTGQQRMSRQTDESWLHLLWRHEAEVIVDRVPAVLKGHEIGSGATQSFQYYGAATVPDGWLEVGHITRAFHLFQRGDVVVLFNLTGAQQHNGTKARILDDEPTGAGRWRVQLLDDTTQHGRPEERPLGVKPGNLRLAAGWTNDPTVILVKECPRVRANTGWARVWDDFGPWKSEPGQPPYVPQYTVWMPTCDDSPDFFAIGVVCVFGEDIVEPDFHVALVHRDHLCAAPPNPLAQSPLDVGTPSPFSDPENPAWTDAGTQAAFDLELTKVNTVVRSAPPRPSNYPEFWTATSMWPTVLTMVDLRNPYDPVRIPRDPQLALADSRLYPRSIKELRWV